MTFSHGEANGRTPRPPSCATTPCSRAASCARPDAGEWWTQMACPASMFHSVFVSFKRVSSYIFFVWFKVVFACFCCMLLLLLLFFFCITVYGFCRPFNQILQTSARPGVPQHRKEGLAGIFGVPERYIDSITFKRLGWLPRNETCGLYKMIGEVVANSKED